MSSFRYRLALAFAVQLGLAGFGCSDDAPTEGFPVEGSGFIASKIVVDGVDRNVELYLPNGRQAGAPLVIVCHGTDGKAKDAIGDAAGDQLAEAQKAVVVAPQARKMPAGDWDQHGPGQVYFETHPNLTVANNNDLKLIQTIIDQAKQAYAIDEKRIYVVGYSNGAFFAQFVAMALPDRVAAFASVAGGLVRCDGTDSCNFRGSASNCADLASAAGWCSCAGADKPIAASTSVNKPAAFLFHAADDDAVSVYYTCELADRLGDLNYDVTTVIRPTGGHAWPDGFLQSLWPSLSKRSLP